MKNQGHIYTDHILKEDAGLTVADFYARHYRHSGKSIWKERILAGEVTHNGRIALPDGSLREGDTLSYHRPPWDEPDVPKEYSILYENAKLVVVNKPSGLPVLPAGGYLENTLLAMIRKDYGETCSPLHRLGRGTSGAILFTLDSSSARLLGRAMREKRIEKIYLAWARGVNMPDQFSVSAPIGPIPYFPTGTLHAYSPAGKEALSHFQVIRRNLRDDASLVQAKIITGRPHQIRIHLSHAGFPLVGDRLFGKGGVPVKVIDENGSLPLPGDCGYSLHSWKIRFPNPETGMDHRVICAPPAGMNPEERVGDGNGKSII